jgi:hypothetical protein
MHKGVFEHKATHEGKEEFVVTNLHFDASVAAVEGEQPKMGRIKNGVFQEHGWRNRMDNTVTTTTTTTTTTTEETSEDEVAMDRRIQFLKDEEERARQQIKEMSMDKKVRQERTLTTTVRNWTSNGKELNLDPRDYVMYRKWFNLLDHDQNEYLTKKDFGDAIENIAGIKISDPVLNQVMKNIDKNGNNQISYNEFLAVIDTVNN